jgi:hypothetical protein
MAQYQVKGPDGQIHVFSGPDGATPDQVVAAAQQFFAPQSAAHRQAQADTDAWAASITPTDGMGTVERYLAGVGKGMTDLARGAGQRLGLVSTDDVAAQRQLDAPLMATTAGKVGNITGKIATALPAMFIPGVNGLAGAAAAGATQGALEPTTADESVLKNAGVGAATGLIGLGAGKAIGAGLRTAKAAAEPFFQAGQQRIIGRALNTAAGSDAPAVQNALQQAAAPFVGPTQPGLTRATMGELVPGSVPTVGQAAGNAGVASLERAATATNPEVTNAISKLLGEQNSARVNVLSDMAGTGGARDFAAAERAGTSDQLYGQARATGIDPAALSPEAQANIAKMNARIPESILNDAKELAKIKGQPLDDSTSLDGLHYVKMALDGAISKAKAAGDSTKASALTGLQNDFLAGLDNLSPEYAAARSTHAAMSVPVNQMDVAQALLDKSVNPLTETLQPAAYARALNDKTAQAATGFNGATLEGTMTNQQNNLLQSILADVQRSNAANNAGRGAGSDTVQKLAYTNLLDQSGVPTFLRELKPAQIAGNLAARGADVAYGRANKELASQLAQTMLSPADASAAMSAAAQDAQPNALLELLKPYLLTGARTVPPAVLLGSRK